MLSVDSMEVENKKCNVNIYNRFSKLKRLQDDEVCKNEKFSSVFRPKNLVV